MSGLHSVRSLSVEVMSRRILRNQRLVLGHSRLPWQLDLGLALAYKCQNLTMPGIFRQLIRFT